MTTKDCWIGHLEKPNAPMDHDFVRCPRRGDGIVVGGWTWLTVVELVLEDRVHYSLRDKRGAKVGVGIATMAEWTTGLEAYRGNARCIQVE